MSVREVVAIGDPVLRQRARELSDEEIASPEIQGLIDDLIETKRIRHGAGIAANQVGEPVRVAIVEVEEGNPRYPYKPPVPLTVIINPTIEALGDEMVEINEGCLSVPDLRGDLPAPPRHPRPLPRSPRQGAGGDQARADRRHLPA